MGIFRKIKKRKLTHEEKLINDIDNALESNKVNFSDINVNNKEQREQFVKSCYDQIVIARKELENAKSEYNLVTTYLSDIQKIEELPINNKAEVVDLAREIVNLNDERKAFQSNASQITDRQYAIIEENEDEILKVIGQLKEEEVRISNIKKDMNYLEAEKNALKQERRAAIKSQKNMTGFAIITLFTVIITFVVLAIMRMIYRFDIEIGYAAVALGGSLVATAIFVKMRYNVVVIRSTELKINRAISLLNSAKIRYVNSVNMVEYVCDKYAVKGGYELEYLWEQYLETKKEKATYRMNTSDLDYCTEQLMKILHKYKINAPSVWQHQALALIDEKEMVEVRHSLIVQRQNLRKRVEYNVETIKEAKENISKIASMETDNIEEVMSVIKSAEDLIAN